MKKFVKETLNEARGSKIVVPSNDLYNVVRFVFEKHVSGTIYEDDEPVFDELVEKLKGKRVIHQYDLYQMTNSLEWADGPLDEESNEQFTEYLWSYLTHEDNLYGPHKEEYWDEDVYEDMGGVGTPMSTLTNTPGVGTAVPAGSSMNTDGAAGSGDAWGDSSLGMQTNEGNLNPYDKIGAMMAKKMGVPQPFKKKDSRTNTIEQNHWEELDEDQPDNTTDIDEYIKNPDKVMNNAKKRKVVNEEAFQLQTLDDYAKASQHVPDHPLTSVKKKEPKLIKEETVRDEQALKDENAKPELEKLGIAFEFKPAKSGKKRTFIATPIRDVLELIEKSEWEVYGKNPENTIRKWVKGDDILTIYADGKDRPRATLTKKEEQEVAESVVIKKVVSASINPYMK